jgi:hypothetical protein
MAKPKTEFTQRMDDLQAALRPAMRRWGFRARGRTFNRGTRDGLTQVISLQMGSFDPPGTVPIPGLRPNLYGWFTINLGVYVPEVAKHYGGGEAGTIVHEYHCCVRARLGKLGPEQTDTWWDLRSEGLGLGLQQRLERDGLPFLERFATRDAILGDLMGKTENIHLSPPRIVCAIILIERGRRDEARRLLAAQAGEAENPHHQAYVRRLAEKLGLGGLDA